MSNQNRAISVRLPDETMARLEVFARAEGEGGTISEVIRSAVDLYLATRSKDEEFRARLKRRLEQDLEVLKGLAQEIEGPTDLEEPPG